MTYTDDQIDDTLASFALYVTQFDPGGKSSPGSHHAQVLRYHIEQRKQKRSVEIDSLSQVDIQTIFVALGDQIAAIQRVRADMIRLRLNTMQIDRQMRELDEVKLRVQNIMTKH